MNSLKSIFLLFSVLFIIGCGDDPGDDPIDYVIPTTYNFENVSYSGQLQRLAMLSEMKNYMATSQVSGVTLEADKLEAMFVNDVANAGFTNTYDESKQLKSKTFANVQEDFSGLLVELATASQSTVPGEEGVSGVIESLDGAKSYLIGEDGLDHAQVIEKGLMGACLFYQITSIYTGSGKMDVDNETVEPGEGTEMEHHWDEAFGYFGVPIDFPTTTDGISFIGSYSDQRNEILSTNATIMDAYLKGRAAISAKDLPARDEAILELRNSLEMVMMGSAIHYLNSSIANFDDRSLKGHALSEAIGFLYALQFNEGKRITNTQVSDLLTIMAGSSDFSEMNLYQVSIADLESARDQLATIFGLSDEVKESL